MATQGERIQKLMDIFNIPQAELAKNLGIPKSSFSMYVSNKRHMKQDRIKLLADLYDISEAWIMGYDVPMKRKENDDRYEISDDEKIFLESYRNSDEDTKKMIDRLLKYSSMLLK